MLNIHKNIGKGQSFPIGASIQSNGVNFSIYSKYSTGIELLLFNNIEDNKPSHIIVLDKKKHKTDFYWHIFIEGLKAEQIYAFRVHGPFLPDQGLRFNPEKVLLDPYSKLVVTPKGYQRDLAIKPGDNISSAMKSVVVDTSVYNWEGDHYPRRSFSKTIIYELHVKGFTKHPNSGIENSKRGTYAGLIEKIPYLKDLGITAIELLPIFQFDEQDAPKGNINYWGYSPVSFFAPHSSYCSSKNIMGPLDEFRDMVKALHKAGIEVILDVVYNHTSEGGKNGPTFSLKGIENRTYYLLEGETYSYGNYSGCGNTINPNNSVARRMIMDSLQFWVSEMHVDGFRFDLASILSRDELGVPQKNPPILWEIESDPILAGTKLIAEAWDAAGLYQVGTFIGGKWKEWNGKFRDDVRSFIKGDEGAISNFAARVLASPDIYGSKNRSVGTSINFITCHDGFTLNDLVSYSEKHNEANGENNRDGNNDNLSWNCGIEGLTADSSIIKLREQQIKNFMVVTLLSYGTPMLLMGDEVGRTQLGNNNAYCQDNEISWFNWELLETNKHLFRFIKMLNMFRINRDSSKDDVEPPLLEFLQKRRKIDWHGVQLDKPDWSSISHSLAGTVRTKKNDPILYIVCNAYSKDLDFEIPEPQNFKKKNWYRIIDTSLSSPDDIVLLNKTKIINVKYYTVKARSIILLIAP